MKNSMLTIAVVVAAAAIVVAGVESAAMTPAPAPAPDCMTLLYGMSDCLTYVEQGSNATKPDKACCPELAELLKTKPICLCMLLGKSSDLPVQLDLNRALKLPSVCKLQTPPLSACSAVRVPVGAPATSTGGPSPAAAETSSTVEPTGEGSSSGKNGAPNITYTNLPYLIASLVLAFTSLSSIL